MELYVTLRPVFLGLAVGFMCVMVFMKEKEHIAKTAFLGVISALLMIASVIAAKD